MSNPKNTVDFKTTSYFPGYIIGAGVAFVIVGIAALTINQLASALLFGFSLLVLTTHYRLRIDLDGKTYHDYLWILGLRNGEKGSFESLECLLYRKSRVSQKMQLRGASSTIHKDVYEGYLVLSDSRKIYLQTTDSRESMVKFLQSKAALLNLRVVDYDKQAV